MKHLLFTVLFIPLLSFGQDDCEEFVSKVFEEKMEAEFKHQLEMDSMQMVIEKNELRYKLEQQQQKQQGAVLAERSTIGMGISVFLSVFFFLTTLLFLILFLVKGNSKKHNKYMD